MHETLIILVILLIPSQLSLKYDTKPYQNLSRLQYSGGMRGSLQNHIKTMVSVPRLAMMDTGTLAGVAEFFPTV